MVDELQHAIELARRQSEEEQRQIAQLIFDELEDHAWEESPELAAAIAEARAEIARGEVMDFEDYDHARRRAARRIE